MKAATITRVAESGLIYGRLDDDSGGFCFLANKVNGYGGENFLEAGLVVGAKIKVEFEPGRFMIVKKVQRT